MEVTCDNALCRKVFRYKEGPAHFKRRPRHFCSISCLNTTHGLGGTKRHSMWETAKRRAKANGVPFALTPGQMPEIPAWCPVLGIEIVANNKAGPLDSSPSLDRIIPAMGYVPGNVRVISNRANRLRADATTAELLRLYEDSRTLESHHA